VDSAICFLFLGCGFNVHGERPKTRPSPPATIPAKPPTISQRLRSVGVPLTACVTSELTELDAFNPYANKTAPTINSTIAIILGMFPFLFLLPDDFAQSSGVRQPLRVFIYAHAVPPSINNLYIYT
jgi:hypothetical protein